MPETKGREAEIAEFFTPADIDLDSVPYADKQREKIRQKKLTTKPTLEYVCCTHLIPVARTTRANESRLACAGTLNVKRSESANDSTVLLGVNRTPRSESAKRTRSRKRRSARSCCSSKRKPNATSKPNGTSWHARHASSRRRRNPSASASMPRRAPTMLPMTLMMMKIDQYIRVVRLSTIEINNHSKLVTVVVSRLCFSMREVPFKRRTSSNPLQRVLQHRPTSSTCGSCERAATRVRRFGTACRSRPTRLRPRSMAVGWLQSSAFGVGAKSSGSTAREYVPWPAVPTVTRTAALGP